MKVFDFKRFRQEKKITQVELAELLSCKQSFISLVESGKRPLPQPMIDILESKFGNTDDYITNETQDVLIKDVAPEDILLAGADAFSRQVVQMMNDKLIAPYGMLSEKDKEREKLNRKIGKLEAELEAAKKGNAPKEGSAICADVG